MIDGPMRDGLPAKYSKRGTPQPKEVHIAHVRHGEAEASAIGERRKGEARMATQRQ